MSRLVQSLWIGPRLSRMEQLAISSFLHHGHDYHLYVYDAVKNVPRGAVVRDAGEILPSSMIFQYKKKKTYAGFSNFFRYKLLLERGGWWVDTDVVCLKPFDFTDEVVFSTERCYLGVVVTSGILQAPAGSEVMAYAWRVCQEKNSEELVWGEVGPRLMGEAVRRFSLEEYVRPYRVFCPLECEEWHKILDPGVHWELDDACSIHLWNEMWRKNSCDKNARYDPGCLYERLKARYLGCRPGDPVSLRRPRS